ncbi:MAG: hypothetical protein KJ949_03240 [Nanoarchaeota archaeon]|nr:hypothetical protein [Nanoarchaeota archaeon]
MKKSLKNKLAILGTFLFMTTSPFGIYELTEKIIGNPYNVKTMPQIQPWVWLYDKNNDGEADVAMVGMRGGIGGAIPAVHDREPTKKEKDWYRKN